MHIPAVVEALRSPAVQALPVEAAAPVRQALLIARGDAARAYKPLAAPMPLWDKGGLLGQVVAIEQRGGPGGESQAWATVETEKPLDPSVSFRVNFTAATGPKYQGEGNRRARRGQAAARRRSA